MDLSQARERTKKAAADLLLIADAVQKLGGKPEDVAAALLTGGLDDIPDDVWEEMVAMRKAMKS